jgi:hypothetical protein
MDRDKLELLMKQASGRALEARRRIERAVDAGELPAWVLATCEQWENAAFNYGAGSALHRPQPMPATGQSQRVH